MFLWNGKQGKIKRSVIEKQYFEGGLKMLNVRNFLSSMKISWLRRLSFDSEWKDFTLNLFPRLGHLKHFGAEYANIIIENVENPFWKDVVKHYKKLCTKCSVSSVHEFMSECIHYNTNIIRGRRVVYVREWCDYDIFYVKNIINDNGQFMTYNQFLLKYPGIRTNFILS